MTRDQALYLVYGLAEAWNYAESFEHMKRHYGVNGIRLMYAGMKSLAETYGFEMPLFLSYVTDVL